MRKKLSVLLICSVVLVSMLLTPTLIADARRAHRHRGDDDDDDDEKHMKFIRCDISGSLNWVLFIWEGVIDGDIEGEFIVTPIGQYFEYPPYEVFWEEWSIETDEGTITILDAGVWSFETFKVQAAGPVVDATGKWKYLIGSTMYISGVTSEFPVDPPTPVTFEGELWITFDDYDFDDDDYDDDDD